MLQYYWDYQIYISFKLSDIENITKPSCLRNCQVVLEECLQNVTRIN